MPKDTQLPPIPSPSLEYILQEIAVLEGWGETREMHYLFYPGKEERAFHLGKKLLHSSSKFTQADVIWEAIKLNNIPDTNDHYQATLASSVFSAILDPAPHEIDKDIHLGFLISVKREGETNAFCGNQVVATVNLLQTLLVGLAKQRREKDKRKIIVSVFVGDTLQAYNDIDLLNASLAGDDARYETALETARGEWKTRGEQWIAKERVVFDDLVAKLNLLDLEIILNIMPWAEALAQAKKQYDFTSKYEFLFREYTEELEGSSSEQDSQLVELRPFSQAVREKSWRFLEAHFGINGPDGLFYRLEKKMGSESPHSKITEIIWGCSDSCYPRDAPDVMVACYLEELGKTQIIKDDFDALRKGFTKLPAHYIKRLEVDGLQNFLTQPFKKNHVLRSYEVAGKPSGILTQLFGGVTDVKTRVLNLFGMPGVGVKTVVASLFEETVAYFEIQIQLTSIKDKDSLKRLAKTLGTYNASGKLFPAVKDGLEVEYKKSGKCALFLVELGDGELDEKTLNVLLKFVPENNAVVIVTSRKAPTITESELDVFNAEIHPMAQNDAILLLQKFVPEVCQDELTPLVDYVGRLPLALEIIGSMLRDNPLTSPEVLLSEIHSKPSRFINETALPEGAIGQLPLLQVFNHSLSTFKLVMPRGKQEGLGQKIKRNKEVAREILIACSMLGRAPLPLSLLRAWFTERYADEETVVSQFDDFIKALIHSNLLRAAEFASFSYLDPSEKEGCVCHCMLQTVIKEQIRAADICAAEAGNEENVGVEAKIYQSVMRLLTGWNFYSLYNKNVTLRSDILPHFEACGQAHLLFHSAATTLLVWHNFFSRLGDLHYKSGDLELAKVIFSDFLENSAELFPDNDLKQAVNLTNLGNVVMASGLHEKAEAIYHKALEHLTKIFSKDSIFLTLTQSHLANAEMLLEKYDESEKRLNAVLECQVEVYGENHREVGTTLSSLGRLELGRKNYPRAQDLLEQALRLTVAGYGDNHYNTSCIIRDLASVDLVSGRGNEALEKYQRAVSIQVEVFGQEHIEVAVINSNIARVYYYLKNFKKAAEICATALPILQHIYGDKDPRTQSTKSILTKCVELASTPQLDVEEMGALSASAFASGDFETAKLLCLVILNAQIETFGSDATEVANTRHILAIINSTLYKKAEGLSSRAGVDFKVGNYTEALSQYQEAHLILLEFHHGLPHADLARSYYNIGATLQCLDDYDGAMECLEESKAMLLVLQKMAGNTNEHAMITASLVKIQRRQQACREALESTRSNSPVMQP